MKTCIFCFSDAGAQLAFRLCDELKLPRGCVHTNEKFAEKYGFTAHNSVFDAMGGLFDNNDALIFVCAAGIAVRAVAPHIRSKTSDPAVLVIDDRGSFVIPLLSGHIGGANALARRLAAMLSATAVITTATDGAGRFACDEWAAENDCAVSSIGLAKDVSAEILTGDIPICSDRELPDELPGGLVRGSRGDIGIYIGTRIVSPYARTLRLIPRTVNVGIGCRRGTPGEAILAAVREVFEKEGFDIRAIKRIASIDVKSDEEGLHACAEALRAEAVFFSAEELNAVRGDFTESDFVRDTVGTGSVCERAAVRAGGRLIIKKTVCGGVTVAAAEEHRRIEF